MLEQHADTVDTREHTMDVFAAFDAQIVGSMRVVGKPESLLSHLIREF
jgi:hypothetical protein